MPIVKEDSDRVSEEQLAEANAQRKSCRTAMPDLETLCPDCEGSGELYCPGEFVVCDDCGGTGYRLTEAGKKVAALMRHNFRPMMRRFRAEKE